MFELRLPPTLDPEFGSALRSMQVTILRRPGMGRAWPVRISIAGIDAEVLIENPGDGPGTPARVISTRSSSRGPEGWAPPALVSYLATVDAYWFVSALYQLVRAKWPAFKSADRAMAREEHAIGHGLQKRRAG